MEKKTHTEILQDESSKYISQDHRVIDEAVYAIINDPDYKDELQIFINCMNSYASQECVERDSQIWKLEQELAISASIYRSNEDGFNKRIYELEGKLKKIEEYKNELSESTVSWAWMVVNMLTELLKK